MKEFRYTSQDGHRYLECEFQSEELNSFLLGMLDNNRIKGIAPVIKTQLNETGYFKFDITGKTTLDECLKSPLSSEEVILYLTGILESVIESGEYMIESDYLVLDAKYIFVDTKKNEMMLLCVPLTVVNKGESLQRFLKELLMNMSFQTVQDGGFLTSVLNLLNDKSIPFPVLNQKLKELEENGKKEVYEFPVKDKRPVMKERPDDYVKGMAAISAVTPGTIDNSVNHPEMSGLDMPVPMPLKSGGRTSKNKEDKKKKPGSGLFADMMKKKEPLKKPEAVKPPFELPVQKEQQKERGGPVVNGKVPAVPYLLQLATGRKTVIHTPQFRIGRNQEIVDLVLGNPKISKSHALILCKNGSYYFKDLDSANHSYKNGVLLAANQEYLLEHGVRLRLADEEFEFCMNQ